ncbi:nucleoside-diphosphate-sugar epimerase [[Clostridium] sordellii]|uniref:NAD-dependent epimerase/dehydratase family protein n=1 Tax=Paraclostridium sordellii TaxID=1505 RepID=UPI0005E2B6F2|nr:NAD-dependent epimerase/dehydratase family protein [Paeniclostridium sordellii]CEN91462.1 nucleoside-diphosphate-sugar epimerase [[Clostridium] sordellii] [Paeniclostridium sordellii]
MKVLITGVNGFIGSNIYKGLKSKQDILGTSQSINSKICDKYISCDLTDKEKLREVLKEHNDIDVIVHCAALAHNKGDDLSKDRFMKVNYEVTKDLVDFSNEFLKLKQFIFLSTISVYGERMDKNLYVEDDKCYPKSPYAVAKKMSEEYIIKNCKSNYYILRLAPVYSKEFRLNIKRRSEIKGFNYVVGTGENKLSLCNVENIVSVVDKIIDKRVFENEIYNISDKDIYTYNDLLNMNKVSNIKVWIPKLFLKLLYSLNEISAKKQFIQENSIKLISDNIYPSNKLYQSIK